jgi:hypothetical protein
MESADESRMAKIAMAISLPFFFSCFQSCDDLCYRCWGKTATAVISKISGHHSHGGLESRTIETDSRGGVEGYDVYFEFANANQNQRPVSGQALVGTDEVGKYFVGRTIEVEYRGSEIVTCRIKGSGGWFWQTFFVVSLAAFVTVVIAATLRINREEKKRQSRRRS